VSNKLSIKVKIADREYPLSVLMEEEEGVRKAAKLINDNIKSLDGNYSVRDKQDLIAMTALQYATLVVQGKLNTIDDDNVVNELKALKQRTTEYLSKK
jgi:cell division protein ZapA (FtsZ GTPase activity inhibitor)